MLGSKAHGRKPEHALQFIVPPTPNRVRHGCERCPLALGFTRSVVSSRIQCKSRRLNSMSSSWTSETPRASPEVALRVILRVAMAILRSSERVLRSLAR